MTADPPIVLTSGSAPRGLTFPERELSATRTLLEANGYRDRPGWQRALGSEHPALRGAAYQLLAEDATADDGELLARGLADTDGVARAWAAFGLERVTPGAGRPTLRELAQGPVEFGEYAALIAAAALARLGDAAGFATIARADAAFDERVPVVQRLYWFARLGVDEVWPLYAHALADDTPGVRALALAQLRELKAPSAQAVIERFVATHPADADETEAARAVLAQRTRPS